MIFGMIFLFYLIYQKMEDSSIEKQDVTDLAVSVVKVTSSCV